MDAFYRPCSVPRRCRGSGVCVPVESTPVSFGSLPYASAPRGPHMFAPRLTHSAVLFAALVGVILSEAKPVVAAPPDVADVPPVTVIAGKPRERRLAYG